jgi:hypothetical protein
LPGNTEPDSCFRAHLDEVNLSLHSVDER